MPYDTNVLHQIENERKDRVLDELEKTRASLITIAETIANRIDQAKGCVTSTDVFQEMIARGYDAEIAQVDKRFMGAVFRPSKGWARVGYAPLGSHARPISIWRKVA